MSGVAEELGLNADAMSDGSDFPDDGYDYSQHFRKADLNQVIFSSKLKGSRTPQDDEMSDDLASESVGDEEMFEDLPDDLVLSTLGGVDDDVLKQMTWGKQNVESTQHRQSGRPEHTKHVAFEDVDLDLDDHESLTGEVQNQSSDSLEGMAAIPAPKLSKKRYTKLTLEEFEAFRTTLRESPEVNQKSRCEAHDDQRSQNEAHDVSSESEAHDVSSVSESLSEESSGSQSVSDSEDFDMMPETAETSSVDDDDATEKACLIQSVSEQELSDSSNVSDSEDEKGGFEKSRHTHASQGARLAAKQALEYALGLGSTADPKITTKTGTATSTRPSDETPEEKRARKKAVAAEKKEVRQSAKATEAMRKQKNLADKRSKASAGPKAVSLK